MSTDYKNDDNEIAKQITKYRDGILRKTIHIIDFLFDEKLNFPVEDQTEHDQGYEEALLDVKSGVIKLLHDKSGYIQDK